MTEDQEFKKEITEALQVLTFKQSEQATSNRQFRTDTMEALNRCVDAVNTINNALGVLHVALQMLCNKHGDDPEALMDAARDHIKQEAEE